RCGPNDLSIGSFEPVGELRTEMRSSRPAVMTHRYTRAVAYPIPKSDVPPLLRFRNTIAFASGDGFPKAMSELGQSDFSRCLPYDSFTLGRWGNRPASLWIAEDFGCCASG